MLTANSEHRIAVADRLRSCRELGQYKGLCFGLVPRSTRTLLDLGCATGEDVLALAERLGPDCQVIGVEVEPDLVEEARRRARNVAFDIHFVVSDCRALPFDSARFDVVRADGVLGMLSQRHRALAECARVLRPGGVLIVHDEVTRLESELVRAGLTVVTTLDIPCGQRATPTWLLTKHEARHDARV